MKYNRSTLRTIEILEIIAENTDITLSDMAKKLNIPISSAYDIVFTLMNKSMVELSDERLKTYRLGVKNLFLGNAFIRNTDVISIAKPYLDELSQKVGNTVFLAKLSDTRLTYIYKHEPSNNLVSTCKIGAQANLSNTALGKIMLAYNSELRSRILDMPLIAATKYTITDPIELEENLRIAHDNGYAIDNFEHDERIICVAFPIFDTFGKVEHSISISGVAHDSRNIEHEIELGKEYAKKISALIGYK